jgi:hypothetical protein
MAKCCECNNEIEPGASDYLVGFGADGELRVHTGACHQTYVDRSTSLVKCKGCPRSFDPRTGERGRPREFHDDDCRRSYERRIRSLLADASLGRTPDTLDAVDVRLADVAGLVERLRSGEFNGKGIKPGVMGRTLSRYSTQLVGRRKELLDEQRHRRAAQDAEQARAWLERQRQASDADVAALGKVTWA